MKAMAAHFEGELETRWLVGPGPDRQMELTRDFAFVDSRGYRWVAMAGDVIDGASIPKMLWSEAVGTPFTGDYRRASVLHDVACKHMEATSKDVHRMFYEAMIADGTEKARALLFYTAVRLFGPKWGQTERIFNRGQAVEFTDLEAALDGVN